MRRALALDWVQPAVAERLAALATDRGKAPAAANGSLPSTGRAAKAAAAQHPLHAPAELLERLRRELRLSKLQAATVWRVLLYVVGKGEASVVAGVESLIRGAIVAQVAAAKEDAQGAWQRRSSTGLTRVGSLSCEAQCDPPLAHNACSPHLAPPQARACGRPTKAL